MKEACKNCKWWEPTKGSQGICYGATPRPQIMGSRESEFTCAWPETPKDARCPAFKAAE